jgi:formamidopyrimidine-DNA glycosylase
VPLAPGEMAAALEGRTIERLERRGKYLDFVLSDEAHLLVHLRMTGTLLYDPAPDTPYARVRFDLGDGHHLLFCDPRRFGTGELALGDEAREAFFAARLGVEPLGDAFTVDYLRPLARKSRAPIKAFLLDQTKIAGVGNIYADEALYRARIHPLRRTSTLKPAQLAELRDAIVATLEKGIDHGGSTIDDFRHPDGVAGSFQNEFLVHTRRGEACGRCGGTIVKFVAAGRGTYACERCQPRPRARRRA